MLNVFLKTFAVFWFFSNSILEVIQNIDRKYNGIVEENISEAENGKCETNVKVFQSVVTYVEDVQPILLYDCYNCHGEELKNGAPIQLTTYEQVKTNINLINSRINNVNNPMPRSGLLAQRDRDVIAKWIEGGLVEK